MRAEAILCLARVMRAAIVGSLTRKARATSAVVSPHTRRSVSAHWASVESAGWQQMNTSRSRSSSTTTRVVVDLRRLLDVVLHQQRQRARQRRVATLQVERPAPGDRGQPRAGVGRDAVARPPRERAGVGVLHALLGEVQVAGHAHRRGEHECPLATVRVGDRGGDLGVRRSRSAPGRSVEDHHGPHLDPAERGRARLGDGDRGVEVGRPRSGRSRRAPPWSRRTRRR